MLFLLRKNYPENVTKGCNCLCGIRMYFAGARKERKVQNCKPLYETG